MVLQVLHGTKLPRKKLCTEDDITFAEDPTSVVYRTIN